MTGLNPFGSDSDEEDVANQPVSGYKVTPLQPRPQPQQPQAQVLPVQNLRGSAPATPLGARFSGEL